MRFDILSVDPVRFWSLVARGDGCWPWTGARDGKGYGRLMVRRPNGGRVSEGVHRIAFALTNGPILNGLHVLHQCDNPCCVRPDHLRLGTHADNMADMKARGRRATGPLALSPEVRARKSATMKRTWAEGRITPANSLKTACAHGHPFSPENTKLDRFGYRHCRACQLRRNKDRYRTAKAFGTQNGVVWSDPRATGQREMVADPHDMAARRRFVSCTFNVDHLAADLVRLADASPPNRGQEADAQ